MAPQDTFIDEEDDTCPLCIEEFDLSDRNFRPCPCGYQVCQFCFNNIRTNMNGLCPACRRPYDEKTIQWKVVTAEEVAEFRANMQKNRKKRAEQQGQKEVQKRDAEKESRKNLVGIRVVQKNLVYVTGLTPTVREDELLKTLRKPEFFGQYGNIQKISISNRKTSDGQNQSLGIYVTFEKKEDAQRCIQAVNGSQNGDRVLKAQLGTTKYCSAWLRHEQCTNRQCMFLHELGDEEDSYTRQDLSSLNSIHTQRPLNNAGPSSRSASRQQVHPPPAQSAAPPMVRSSSKEGSENGDGSALPSSANWARSNQIRSRRGSHATSGAASSPAVSMSLPVTAETTEEAVESGPHEESSSSAPAEPTATQAPTVTVKRQETPFEVLFNHCMTALADCPEPFPGEPENIANLFPPLFDLRGAEKRRAMRLEEEARLSASQEEEEQLAAALEASDDEPENSGSLALGGEPEDRDNSRDVRSLVERRAGAQPPIQRTNAEGLFGPAIGSSYSQTGPNIGSIGSRTMTPQQPFLRQPGSFVEHLPPGISSVQSTLFQGQGHNRQASRFSFANDSSSASSTSVKLAANRQIMAQQSSMMPSAFHSQPGGQYYATSMPGPPPGLKSTGTPPNMFGQGFGGSGFGAAPKDSNELLQSLIRGRGGVGSQAHDAGKREYMFSSFPNQYPPSTSSTPAPASGLLASLYGSQPGAFQDFGSKQKKKGKKHRHANTSSSGGSGLVDLADPSILQARMQHQQQSNAGVGQGLFAGQSSDDELPSLDEATTSVDALVSDEPSELLGSTTPSDYTKFARVGTPSIPPGLGLPHPHLSPAVPQAAVPGSLTIARPSQAAAPVPVLPLHPASPSAGDKAVKKASAGVVGSDAKKSIKALALESGLSKDIASQSNPTKGKKVLQDEDFPALDTAKLGSSQPAAAAVAPPKVSSGKTSTAGKKMPVEPTVGAPAEALAPKKTDKKADKKAEKKADKKPVPGILNIAAATKAAPSPKSSNPPSATEKSVTDQASFPSLPTPTTASAPSPVMRSAPKTIKIVSTPRTEAPPSVAASVAASVAGSSIMAGSSARSSGVPGHRPETPASEAISDTASIISASASASRTNSPPPSRIGSAAVRSTTKSQQRKQRKDAHKKESALITSQPKPEPEIEIAPILGRKKKQKKEKPEKEKTEKPASSTATPMQSRPQTPAIQPALPPAKEESSAYRQAVNESMSLEEPVSSRGRTGKYNIEAKDKEGGKSVESTAAGADPDIRAPSPATLFQELIADGLDPDTLSFLKPVSGTSHRNEFYSPSYPKEDSTSAFPTVKQMVTEEDRAALAEGKVVRKVIDGCRVMLTPNGDCIRNLTREEEDRYLELQSRLAKDASNPASFVCNRQEAGHGFSVVKGRAVSNGPPSYFPQTPNTYTSDPVSKMTREEALGYINQAVLPRLNLPGSPSFATGAAKGNTASHAANTLNALNPMILNLANNGIPGAVTPTSDAYTLPTTATSGDDFSGLAANSATSPMDTISDSAITTTAKSSSAAVGSVIDNFKKMSLEEIEVALAAARKDSERIEKTVNQVIKRNRRLMLTSSLGGGH